MARPDSRNVVAIVTDEERHEVAKRLRVLACTPDEIGITEHAVIRDLGISAGIYDDCCRSEDVLAVADLIDRPTCRIWYVPGSVDRSCSACGVTFSTGTYQGGDHEEHEFMFCPNCGAEVV